MNEKKIKFPRDTTDGKQGKIYIHS